MQRLLALLEPPLRRKSPRGLLRRTFLSQKGYHHPSRCPSASNHPPAGALALGARRRGKPKKALKSRSLVKKREQTEALSPDGHRSRSRAPDSSSVEGARRCLGFCRATQRFVRGSLLLVPLGVSIGAGRGLELRSPRHLRRRRRRRCWRRRRLCFVLRVLALLAALWLRYGSRLQGHRRWHEAFTREGEQAWKAWKARWRGERVRGHESGGRDGCWRWLEPQTRPPPQVSPAQA